MSVEKTYFGHPMPELGPQVRCPGCKFFMSEAFLKTHVKRYCKETYWRQARRYERLNHDNRLLRAKLGWGKKREE
jgi:hypothetical protein